MSHQEIEKKKVDPRIDQCPECARADRGECQGMEMADSPSQECQFFVEGPKGMHFDEVDNHPAIGHLEVSKVSSSGGTKLVGSGIGHHNFIEFRVLRGQRQRGLHKDWYHGQKGLVTFRLSPVQMFEMLTTMNTGGMPCTLVAYRDPETGEFVQPDEPPDEGKVRKNYEDFKKQTAKAASKMRVLQKRVEALAEKGVYMGKKALQQLAIDIGVAAQETDSNMPFIAEQFEKSVKHSVKEAKAEVEAFTSAVIHKAGLQSIAQGSVTPEMLLDEGDSGEETDLVRLRTMTDGAQFKFVGEEDVGTVVGRDTSHGTVQVMSSKDNFVMWVDDSTKVLPVKTEEGNCRKAWRGSE